jgi:hypothetical protein
MKYKVKPGDLLYVDENKTFGFVIKETRVKILYLAVGQNGLGGPFEVAKEALYTHIDSGHCLHQVGSTKYRRLRK